MAQEALSHDSVGHCGEKCSGSGTDYHMRKLQQGKSVCRDVCTAYVDGKGGQEVIYESGNRLAGKKSYQCVQK